MLRFLVTVCLLLSACLQAGPLKILSLDGGGMRGMASLELLRKLEKETGLQCHKDFDIYAGSSTGAVIASMLACGLSVDEILQQYQSLAEDALSTSACLEIFKPGHDPEKLRKDIARFVERAGLPLDLKVNQVAKRVVMPTVTLNDSVTGRWGVQVVNNIQPDAGEIELVDAIVDSIAAPTHFPSYEEHIDGAAALNDPSLATLLTAYKLGLRNFFNFRLLSIGAGRAKNFLDSDESWGWLDWIWGYPNRSGRAPLLDLTLDVDQQVSGQLCSQLLGNRYRKIDLILPEATELGTSFDPAEVIDELIQQHRPFWQAHVGWVRAQLL